MKQTYPAVSIAASEETGKLGLMHLKRFWSKMILKGQRKLEQHTYTEEWNLDTALLSVTGTGIYEVSCYLLENNPSFDQFENWIMERTNPPSAFKIKQFNALLKGKEFNDEVSVPGFPLSAEEWQFWQENGYLIVRNAVSKENCQAAVKVICDFLQIKLDDSSTWYTSHSALQGIMVQLFQHPAFQKNRESEKVKAVYQQLYGKNNLFLNTDKAGFNPPETSSYKYRGTGLHWDVSLELPIPFGLQGILYLTDTAENQGAFTCVPGFHNRIEEWLQQLPEGANPRQQDLSTFGAIPIAANAGDFIIWHHTLPHGASANTHTLPRFVQYVNYQPFNFESKEKWR